ncbi:MAG TPA: ROK family protein [Trebonia sp.]|jgi:glucokinase|nr:ROK family protein [Trebonia sp.]
MTHVLALDIGGTKLAAGVVDDAGKVAGFQAAPTMNHEGPDPVIARLFALARRALRAAPGPPVAAVGIACGGPLDGRRGVIMSPPNLPGWDRVPIGPLAEAEFGVPFVLLNDATAAAWGEYRFGAGRGPRSMIYLTVSTGVGGGAVVGGRLHTGTTGNGGEFGHVMVRPGGRACRCGRVGCLEAYASGTSIAERADERVRRGEATVLAGDEPLTSAAVASAARAGDRLAAEVWDEATRCLGDALTDFVNVFEPGIVVLGGGVTRAGEQLLGPVRAIVERNAISPAVLSYASAGEAAGVVGAGAVALDYMSAGPHQELRLGR